MLGEGWRHCLESLWHTRGSSEEGQGLVEYAMILVLVVIIVMVVVVILGPWVGNVYSNIVNAL